MMMLMQETGGELGSFLFMLGGLAMITMVLWIFLPFAVFGIKGRLTNILDEQRRTMSAVNALKSDVGEIARNALRERPRRREISDQGAPSGELEASRFIPNCHTTSSTQNPCGTSPSSLMLEVTHSRLSCTCSTSS